MLRPEVFSAPSLADGCAGAALFFASLARLRPEHDERYAGIALDFLERSIDALAAGKVRNASLYGGFTGIAWAAEQCRAIASDDEDPNSDIDDVLIDTVAQRPWRAHYDLISGLTGLSLYALERRNAALLTEIVDRLSETADVTPDGTAWFTENFLLNPTQRARFPNGYYNLGLSHGVPAVIVVLAQACAAGIAVDKARPLLDGAVRWLLSKENRRRNGGGTFPSVVLRGSDEDTGPTRVSWCYGDLGISLALLWAARSVGEPEWEEHALRLARQTAMRPNADDGIMDAGLCHGAAGNAHLFNRLYQATREPLFLDAARQWFARTLAFRQEKNRGVGGFQAWHVDRGWDDTPGLLEGSVGIGLALLAATGTVTPDWDRMLLVSVPPRES